MLRIFVASSHVSSIFMAIYAKKTHQKDCFDILMVDWPAKKKVLAELILSTSAIHPWDRTIDLSVHISETADLKPSLKKRLIRKFKTKPVIKNIYSILHKRYTERVNQDQHQRLIQLFSSYDQKKVELNLLTKTDANENLFCIFPQAQINYFEHGQGDYMYVLKPDLKPGNFFCVFAEQFRRYLTSKNIENKFVSTLIESDEFYVAVKKIVEQPDFSNIDEFKATGKKKVVLLLENVEIYHVPDNFWTDFIDLCLSKINKPEEFTFIVKPHPTQSYKSIELTQNYLAQKGVEAILFKEDKAINYSAEVLYSMWCDETEFVFSLFSSSVYYISVLYPSKKTTYYYGFDYFKKYIHDSPKQYLDIFYGIEELVKEVLTENCVSLT